MGTPARATWRGDVGVGLAAAAAFLLAWLPAGGLWTQVNSGDLHAMSVPWYEFVAHALWHEGRVPLWTPAQYGGTPVLALGQPASLYPPVLVLFGVLPAWTALQALYALHVAILGAGMAAVLRANGVGRPPALVATLVAVAALFRGPLLAGMDHPAFLGAMAWSPWVLVSWQRGVTGHAGRGIAGIALASAMQWVCGYPDFALDLAVLLGVVALVADVGPPSRRIGVAVAGIVLGVALAAVQIVPVAEAVRESVRTEEGTLQLFMRSLFAVMEPIQIPRFVRGTWGVAAVALALAAFARPARMRLAWAAAFVWSVFALNPPFGWLYLLPPFSGVRFPFGWSGGTAVFLGLLAAAGMGTLMDPPRRWLRAVGVVVALAAIAEALVVVHGVPTALPAFSPGTRAFRVPDVPEPATRARLLAAAAGDDRVLSERDGTSGAAMRHGLRLAMSHEPSVAPRRIVHLLAAAGLWENVGIFHDRDRKGLAEKPVVATLLGVGVVVVSPAHAPALERAGFARVGTLPGGDVMLRRAARPRARLAHRAEVATGGEAGSLAAVLRDPLVPPDAVVLEEGSAHPPIAEPPPSAEERVHIVSDAPERVVIEATVAAPALLVLGDTAYPGWEATVDGAPAPILVADHAFRAVWLPAGQHTVVFAYAPRSVRLGLIVSLWALVATVACVVMPARRG